MPSESRVSSSSGRLRYVLQGGAVQKFHHDERLPVLFADVVNGADIWMVQRRCGPGFALEARQRLRVPGHFIGQKLEGDEALEAAVFRLVDHAHAASANFFDDAVVRDGLADHVADALRDAILRVAACGSQSLPLWFAPLYATICGRNWNQPCRRKTNVQAPFDHSRLHSRTQSFQLCRVQIKEEVRAPPGAPDKAYLEKLMAGWSSGNPANMAQYYDQGEYTFFDIAPLRYSNWAEYQKGVTDLLKNYKSIKLTVNDDAQIHTDGNLTWAAATVKEDAITNGGKHELATLRWTVIFEKQAGKWMIVHEHTSEPLQ